MHLTSEEEKVYNGEVGWAHQTSMKILVRLGDLFGATRLIPIKSAHISGVSYKIVGDSTIDFLYAMSSRGGRTQVSSTINPSSFDPKYLSEMIIPQEHVEKQLRIIEAYKKMGVKPALTCTPYYIDTPRRGCHLAWAESSAVIYANSVLGSWTNREGGPSALAAALIGKVPNYGLHQIENRRANIIIKVETRLQDETAFGALGVHVGNLLKDEVPFFEGLSNYTNDELKQLGSGLASSGMTAIFHYGETCEKRGVEKVCIEAEDMKGATEELSTASEDPTLVFLGCPHCSLSEVRRIAHFLKGKKVKEGRKLWICTSRYIKRNARNYVDLIEKSGGRVICDTCAVVTWIKNLGVDSMITNSAKTAYYAPTLSKVNAALAPLSKCIEEACKD